MPLKRNIVDFEIFKTPVLIWEFWVLSIDEILLDALCPTKLPPLVMLNTCTIVLLSATETNYLSKGCK